MRIKGVKARQIYDSRGFPTVEVDVTTMAGTFRASAPSGISSGSHEAVELRDGGSGYMGKGVKKAVANVNRVIGPALKAEALDVQNQRQVDEFLTKLDGTESREKLGANAIIAVSMAICRAAAGEKDEPLYGHIAKLTGTKPVYLPVPSFNIINGGIQAGNALAIQELTILPIGATSFAQAMRIGSEVYHQVKSVIMKKYGKDATNVADHGGFAPNISDTAEALDILTTAIHGAGYGDEVKIGMNVAASEFYKEGKYDLDFKNKNSDPKNWLTPHDLLKLYKQLSSKYPLIVLEDPFELNDWENFSKLTSSFSKGNVFGNDLLVTNTKRIQIAMDKKACTGLTVKLNQVGTVSEVIEACRLAQENQLGVMVSHRSGETEDPFLADLVVGMQAGLIKTGAPCRSERVVKYNQLLRIEEGLGIRARFAGEYFMTPRKSISADISTPV